VDFSQSVGVFNFQNQLFAAATGIDSEVWHRIDGNYLTILGNGVTITDSNSSGYCAYEQCESNSNVVYSYMADADGFMCIHLNLPKRNNYYVLVNGIERFQESISLPQMIAVGDVRAGDVIDIRIETDPGEDSTMTVSAAILNETRFWTGYDILAASALEITTFENTYVAGILRCDREGLLYASIPQNGNWRVLVDGEPAEIKLVGDCMIGVPVTAGDHEIEYMYENRAFTLGCTVSLISALIFGILVIAVYKPQLPIRKDGRGKFQK
jgi:hypothetical protein